VPWTPLGELTALPDLLAGFWGEKRKEKREGKGKGGILCSCNFSLGKTLPSEAIDRHASVGVLGVVLVEERCLEDAGEEDDLVACRRVVGVDRRRSCGPAAATEYAVTQKKGTTFLLSINLLTCNVI